jgi:hypothetical protein
LFYTTWFVNVLLTSSGDNAKVVKWWQIVKRRKNLASFQVRHNTLHSPWAYETGNRIAWGRIMWCMCTKLMMIEWQSDQQILKKDFRVLEMESYIIIIGACAHNKDKNKQRDAPDDECGSRLVPKSTYCWQWEPCL